MLTKKNLGFISLAAVATSAVIVAADWPSQSGGPQRDAWARYEKVFTKDNVSGLELLYKYQSDNKSKGLDSLTSPIINGLLITFRGFKEMLVFGGSSDNVYAVDADLNKLIWKTHFEYHGDQRQSRKSAATCPGGLTATLAMRGSSSAGVSFGRRTPAPAANGPAPPALIGEGGMYGGTGAFFAVGSDGYLHAMNPSTGADLVPAVQFLPPNSRASGLNVDRNTIYAATSGNCGGHPNALYAIDLGSANKKVSSLPTNSNRSGIAGTALGSDGTVYVEMPFEQGPTDATHHRAILALEPLTLAVKDSFTTEDEPSANKYVEEAGITPLVFSWKGKDLIVSAGSKGRLYLLDSTSLGGPDHRQPLFVTAPIADAGDFHGGFSSWTDADSGTRWVYASFWGPLPASAKFSASNGEAAHGGIVAFKVGLENGQPTLAPAWISADIPAPAATVIAGGLVFALSTGEPTLEVKAKGKPYSLAEIEKASTHATLYVLDGENGKQLYSSGSQVTAPAHGSGLAIANGRVYFGAGDNSVYSFGFSKMQPQLTDR